MKKSVRSPFLLLAALFFFAQTVQAQFCQTQITPAGNTTICQGDSVKLQAGFGIEYRWSTGDTSSYIYASNAGNYYVTVTDFNKCISTSGPLAITTLAAPDAALKDTIDNFTNCTYSLATANFKLHVSNDSKTKATNTQYVINWGDGNSSTFGPSFANATHIYSTPGSFQLKLTVTNAAGCSTSKSYTVFNGSNPSFGVASQGNTNDCAPATFTFDIINTAGNTPSTVYTFQFDDGTPAIQYTHANLPSTITHTFLKGAFGKPGNGFTLTATATNPCGTTPATVGGIRISQTPVANFTVNPDTVSCVNSVVKLSDTSNGGFNANLTTNMSGYLREWKITPATGWIYMGGSNNTSQQPQIKFNVAGNYKIELTVTPRGASPKCTSNTAVKNVTIINPPVVAFQTVKTAHVCAPALVNFVNHSTGANLSYKWSVTPKTGWNFTASDSASLNPAINFTKPGNYIITLTAGNSCGFFTQTDTVTIEGAPVVSLPAAKSYCIGKTIKFSPVDTSHAPVFSLNGNTISSFEWLISGPAGSTFVNGTSAASQFTEINFPVAGTYSVALKAYSSCGVSNVATQTITIVPLPQVSVTSSVSAICLGQTTAALTASGANSYTWFPATGLNKTSGASVIANPAITTTYTVTGLNTLTGCADTAQVIVIVKPPVPLTITASTTIICKNQTSAILTASGTDSYTWSPATGLNITTGASVTANPLNSTTYTVTGIDNLSGCTVTKTIRVNVINPPVVSAGMDTALCVGAPVKFNGTPKNGVWSGPHVSTNGVFTPAVAGTFIVTYSFTNANGCTVSDARIVTVTNLPQVFAGNDIVLCAQPVILQLTGSPAGGTWSGSNQVTANGNFDASKAGTYSLIYSFGTGNCQNADAKIITVNPQATVPTIATQAVCPGFPATLTANGNAATYNWYDAFTNGNLLFTGPVFTTLALQTSKTYYVAAVNNFGCEAPARAIAQVTVNPIPTLPVVQNVTFCGTGSQATLTASGTASTFEWYDAATNGNLLFTGSAFLTPALTTTTNYYVQAVNGQGCVSPGRTKVTVTILPQIAANVISGKQTICEGETPNQLTGTNPSGGNGSFNFTWESSTDSINFTPASGNVNQKNYQPGALTQTTWFRRKVVSEVCTVFTETVKITANPKPNAPAAQNKTICAGSAATFNLNSAIIQNTGGQRFEWFDVPAGGSPIFTGSIFTTPSLSATKDYFVQAVSAAGCKSAVRTKFTVTVVPVISGNTISANQTICTGQAPATLLGSTPTGGIGNFNFTWESSTDGINFTAAAGSNNSVNYTPAALTDTTWFRRSVTSGPCLNSISPAIKVTVLSAITNNAITSISQTICAGTAPAILTGSQPTGGNNTYTYVWQVSANPVNGFSTAPGNATRQNYQPGVLTQTTWFRREVKSGLCTEVSAPVKVEVTPVLATNIISASQNIYAGTAPTTLTGTLLTGGNGTYSFEWEKSTTGNNSGFAIIANATAATLKPGIINQTTWFRRIVRSRSCDLVSNIVEIKVVPLISNNVIQQDQIICINNPADSLNGTMPAGGIGQFAFIWEKSTVSANSGFVTANGAANKMNYGPGIINQTTWFRRKVTSGSYTAVSNVIQVKVNPVISNNLISTSQTICAGSTPATLTGTVPNGGSGSFTYLWEMSTTGPNAGFISASGNNSSTNYNPGALQQTTWFRRKVSAGNCQELVSAAVKITVNVVPAPPVMAAVTICKNTNTVLVIPSGLYPNRNMVFEWYENAVGGQLIETGNTFTTPVLNVSTTYYVQVASEGCASLRTPVTVNVRENTADAGEDVTIVAGKSAYLKASGGIKYVWSPAVGLDKTNIPNPTAKPEKTTTYTVEVTNKYGCVSTDQITVTVLPKIIIPNTFTPNTDGVNDTWEITGLADYKNCKVEIFDRWGIKVCSKTGYNQPWNGTSLSGESLPVATYYYIIQLNNGEAPLSGSITIVR